MQPFLKYLPRRSGNTVTLETIFAPEASLETPADGSVAVTVQGIRRPMYSLDDDLHWSRASGNTSGNIQGVLGDRLLATVMEAFLAETTQSLDGALAGVLRETEHQRGKGYAARFNDKYILRFRAQPYLSDANFIILMKGDEPTPYEFYQQERFGLRAAEIDALGYVYGEQKYLIVGEATTKKEFRIYSRDNEHEHGDIFERVFTPLKALFPQHEQVYFLMAPRQQLFLNGGSRLKTAPSDLHSEFEKRGIPVLFVPQPETEPGLTELAERLQARQPLVRALLTHLGH